MMSRDLKEKDVVMYCVVRNSCNVCMRFVEGNIIVNLYNNV